MERHAIDEEAAFHLLRVESRNTSRKLVDVAQGLLDAHTLLPGRPVVPAQRPPRENP
jgi:AmiR/NasT family two-component response regulator